jgi:ABC-type transport system involved in multi-copper enzyme maturation permease subunit
MSTYAPSVSIPGPRLIRAEILKLRKRRSLVVTSIVLTILPVVVFYAVGALLHASNAAKHGSAGGVTNLGYGLLILALLGGVVGVQVGTAAGAGDLSSGVFKELVVTGRARRALFLARVPGGLVFLLPIVAVAYALVALASVVFAASPATPSVGLLVSSGAWVLLSAAFWFVLALGLASLIGSKSATVGLLVAWQLAVGPALAGIGQLGIGRAAIPGAAVGSLAPAAVRQNAVSGGALPLSTAGATLALLATIAVALVLGSWRTETRDA